MRARLFKEETGRGTYTIVITEMPWLVQKSRLVERLADLINEKKLPLVADVRDESAEDVRLAVAMLAVPLAVGDLRVTCSFGVSWTRNRSYKMEELLRDADLALYRAKAGGRNRVESSDADLVADPAQFHPMAGRSRPVRPFR